ncbi:transcriptional repressor MprA [uncultured Roseburia sp.]|uniref:MarR family transcriptional regulator n=1 Tax=Brotonthovivens ammoniilytica TaxID=2981725 RepID=A0ABT2THT1_9FIRM|nr:MarR family transcriptional regulator [Brotonthovivens ammoniilytica]MCU6761754.1 MarR family transcriptional regulator [Brotonthovivens ammoniilytica]SCI45565.1 transcriptional repressor MprA [uncultured Roseburia sp.]
MDINDLIKRFSDTTENQCKAIFSSLFIAGNKLQTIFDNHIPEISLKQFMLLTMIKQSQEQLTFTQLGKLLGCSRQNVKKLAFTLEKKGFVFITKSENDARALTIHSTKKLDKFFETVFISYQEDLHYLFDIYTEKEIQQLFNLMMKLYAGIDNLERNYCDEKK